MQGNKPHILYLITKANFGGAQRYVYDLATGVPPQYNLAVGFGELGVLGEKLREKKIRTIHIPTLKNDMGIFGSARALWDLIVLFYKERPDVLHINSTKAGVLGAFAGRVTGVPRIIFTSHGWVFNEERPWWQKLILKFAQWLTLLFSHKIILVSHETKRQMNWPFVQSKMTVVYNGLVKPMFLSRKDAREFLCEKIPALKKYKNDTWIGTIAELHPVKRHDLMIEALKHVVVDYPNIRHVIIGEGDEQTLLEKKIRESNLDDHVFLVGYVDEASQYLHAFDIFTLTSRSEALAYALIEASYARLPIVASDVGGIPEIISHEKTGLLFKGGDVDELKNALQTLLKSEELRSTYARDAMERAKDFSLEQMIEKTLSLYN